MSKEVLFAELRASVNQMATLYTHFMDHLGRYQTPRESADTRFPGSGTVKELTAKARNEGRLLYDGDDDLIRYYWTHGECNLVALMLQSLLLRFPETEAELVYVVDTEDEGVAANYHALVRFFAGGDVYYADGLMFSKDYRELYRGDALPPKKTKEERWKSSLFYTDPCGLVLFSVWCEVLGLKTHEVLKDWDHPEMLSGGRDLDEYHKLLNARRAVLDTFKQKTIAFAYEAGK